MVCKDLEAESKAANEAEEAIEKSFREAVQQHEKAKATLDKFKVEAQR